MTEVGENMPNDDTTIRCPYYLRSNQTVIYCESDVELEGAEGAERELCAQLCECGEKKGICAGALQAVSGHELCVCNIS